MSWSDTDDLGLLHDLVSVPSVSGAEGEVVSVICRHLQARGFDVHVDAIGNVHGRAGTADAPVIMLLGHVDTVPGHLPVSLRDGVLTGRGAVDAKGPLAAMIAAASRVAGTVPARLVVVGAVGEESTSEGARHLLSGPAPDAIIIGEPSGVHGVGIGYKGVVRLRITLTQPAAHTSSSQPTAAEVACATWHRVAAHLRSVGDPEAPRFEQPLPTLLSVDGDLERATLCVSCRVPPGFDMESLMDWMAADSRGVVEVIEAVPAVRSSRSDPVVRALTSSIRSVGATPVPKLKLGTSDWNVVATKWPVPVAAYGPGDSRLCHTDDEHMEVADFHAAVGILSRAIPAITGNLARQRRALAGASGKDR